MPKKGDAPAVTPTPVAQPTPGRPAGGKGDESKTGTHVKPGTEIPKSDGLSAREHVQNAVTALQYGQEANAKVDLEAALRLEPESKMAKSLMAQIQADPVQYFGGQESFSYTVQSGDSLSTIARRFLDDPLKFHILAKFSDIADPSHLQPGQTIRVPGKKPPEALIAPAVEDTRAQQAKRLYDAAKYQDAIELLESGGAESGEGRDLLVLSYIKFADELAQKANLLEAQNILEKAVTIQPNNDKLKKQLKQVEKQREAARLYKSGMDAVAAGDSAKALDAFTAVLKLDSSHEAAKKQIVSMKSDAVESMHKDAMTEYRKQNLDKAIDLWDRVLALDPSHELAKLYRARAVELKAKLEKLDKK
ncbi:MAG: LysM peptidoglycan-binding domain-containing protein [Gammaproteobacteria bacterium]|nr:LysM peptidoglycan-binding domain-containing protein [Gammaproteobacteria bacterium]